MTEAISPAESMLPSAQLGYILPPRIGDAIQHQFYRTCPPDLSLVVYPLNLSGFTEAAIEAALAAVWPAFDFLAARKVDRIVQAGIPVSAFAGRARILDFIEEASRRAPAIPASADIEESIDGFKLLGCRRIALAGRWDAALMERVGAYLREAGLEMLGWVAEAHATQQVVDIRPQDGVDMALRLGRRAFRENPKADGLLLAGGLWLSNVAIPALEEESGRPVITNPAASYWAFMRQLGRCSPARGFGRLIDSLQPTGP
jgi:maleate cis-trans isomerase